MTVAIDLVNEAMAKAVAEVFENTCFMESMPAAEGVVFEPGEPVLYTRLPIYKPQAGMAGLVVPQSVALNVANTMMMREFTMEEDEFEVMDVLGELANMLGGSLLTHLLPELDSFELGLPECRVITDIEGGKEWDNATPFVFELEGVPFLTTWEGN